MIAFTVFDWLPTRAILPSTPWGSKAGVRSVLAAWVSSSCTVRTSAGGFFAPLS